MRDAAAPLASSRPADAGRFHPPGIVEPRYIATCKADRWALYLHDPKTGRRWATAYRCRSWRHEGPCRRWRSRQNAARLLGPIERSDPRNILLCVLTFDQRRFEAEYRTARACVALAIALRLAAGLPEYFEVDAGDPRWLAFETLWRRWQSLRQALHRESNRRGERRARWAMTVEVHRSGWPHANVLMEAPWLAAELAQEHGCVRKAHPAIACGVDGCIRDWLVTHAESCGFGRILSLEVARDAGAAAGYIVKLAGELEAPAAGQRLEQLAAPAAGQQAQRRAVVVSEVIKFSQVPVNAPPHFRRLRSSRASTAAGVEAMLDPPPVSELEGALFSQAAVDVARAIELDLDLVESVDGDGVVTRSPITARGPPRPAELAGWLDARLLPLRLERERLSAAWTAWYAEHCPEL